MTKLKNWPQVCSSTPHAGPPGYILTVWLISRKENRFGVAGVSDGTPIHREGLKYQPKDGMPALGDESQAYDSLCDAVGGADPSWEASMG